MRVSQSPRAAPAGGPSIFADRVIMMINTAWSASADLAEEIADGPSTCRQRSCRSRWTACRA